MLDFTRLPILAKFPQQSLRILFHRRVQTCTQTESFLEYFLSENSQDQLARVFLDPFERILQLLESCKKQSQWLGVMTVFKEKRTTLLLNCFEIYYCDYFPKKLENISIDTFGSFLVFLASSYFRRVEEAYHPSDYFPENCPILQGKAKISALKPLHTNFQMSFSEYLTRRFDFTWYAYEKLVESLGNLDNLEFKKYSKNNAPFNVAYRSLLALNSIATLEKTSLMKK